MLERYRTWYCLFRWTQSRRRRNQAEKGGKIRGLSCILLYLTDRVLLSRGCPRPPAPVMMDDQNAGKQHRGSCRKVIPTQSKAKMNPPLPPEETDGGHKRRNRNEIRQPKTFDLKFWGKKHNECQTVGGVSMRSRNAALSRKGCVVSGPITRARKKI